MSYTAIAVLSLIWWASLYVAFSAGQQHVCALTRSVAMSILMSIRANDFELATKRLYTLAGLKYEPGAESDSTDGATR